MNINLVVIILYYIILYYIILYYIYIKLYDTYNLVTYINIFKYCITKYFDGSQYDIV